MQQFLQQTLMHSRVLVQNQVVVGRVTGFNGSVIPHTWTPHRRAIDGELVGYLATDDHGTTPLTIFGFALGEATTRTAAARLLDRRGLACLAEPWSLVTGEGAEIEVRILSAYPESITVVAAPYGFYGADSPRHNLAVPTAELSPGRRH